MSESVAASVIDKAKQYSFLKYVFALLDTLYALFLLFIFLGSGLSGIFADKLHLSLPQPYLALPVYLFLASLIYFILDFPFHFYRTFILEHRFSLSKQKQSDWLVDQLKTGAIAYVIGLILLSAFYFLLAHAPKIWWLILSLFWIFFSLILARLVPVIIVPLFFKYKKLEDASLRDRILRLAEKTKIRILDCFEIDFSKKTLKANAAFLGWGSTRRVILADTLKDRYSAEEIEVILAHEFAHYKLGHLLKLVGVNSLATIGCFYLIFKTSGWSLSLFGLSGLQDLAALPLIFIYFLLFGLIMQPFENYISRRLERSADIMALEVTGFKVAFVSMMEKLGAQNLADRSPHPVIKFFFFDHPPLEERIALARRSG